MTKTEAIEAMMEGKNVTHHYFSDHENISMIGSTIIVLTEGYRVSADEFWSYRQGKGFEDGWEEFVEETLVSVDVECNGLNPSDDCEIAIQEVKSGAFNEEKVKEVALQRLIIEKPKELTWDDDYDLPLPQRSPKKSTKWKKRGQSKFHT